MTRWFVGVLQSTLIDFPWLSHNPDLRPSLNRLVAIENYGVMPKNYYSEFICYWSLEATHNFINT